MLKGKIALPIILFFILLSTILQGGDARPLLSLEKTNIQNLSNNAVLCMHQDLDGFMWFGTYDGLNLFNGKDTYTFRFDPDNPHSLSSNIIHNITNAEPGYLWISTFMGLDKFSLSQQRVTESYLPNAESRLLAADSKGNTLVIGQNDFISCYLLRTHCMQDVHSPGINTVRVKTLFADARDRFWMVMGEGELVQITPSSLSRPITLSFDRQSLHNKTIVFAYFDNHRLYFLDEQGDLFGYDPLTADKQLLGNLTELISRCGNLVQVAFFQDDLYLAFANGMLLSLNRPDEALDLNVGLFALQKDANQNILWIGTDGQGVQKLYKKENLFGSILSHNMPFTLHKPIRSLYTDSLGTLWIGTKGDGIICVDHYDKHNGEPIAQEHIRRFTTKQGLSNDRVFCFQKSRYRDVVWIGTDGPELSYYSYTTGRVAMLSNPTGTPITKVHSIHELNDSILWVATAGEGLKMIKLIEKEEELVVKYTESYVFEKDKRVCREFHSMRYIPDSMLFLGSRGGYGLICFDISQKKCRFVPMGHPENSAIGDLLCVHPSKDSTFYFGASSGLTRMQFLSDGTNRSLQFTRKDGLQNDMIHGILEDDEGFLWLSTNKGLAKYNPRNNFFHNYGLSDLKVVEFSDDAYWRCPFTGRLFFGGINGLVWIDRQPASLDPYNPPLYFVDFRTSDGQSLLSFGGIREKEIQIPPSVSSFTVSFVAIDYINGENYEYSYLLEPYNNTWTELQKNNEATFTKLPYGVYKLKVKYKNDVFHQGAIPYVLTIRVLPPWYYGHWAIVGYVLVVLLLMAYVVWAVRRNIIRRQRIVAGKIHEEQKEKLYEAKLRFFTNITHEICTPLTLINGVSDNIRSLLQADKNKLLMENVDVLSDNVRGLNELIQEILDFRKIEEMGMPVCRIRRVSVSHLMSRQSVLFAPIAHRNGIRFSCSVPEELYWNTDASILKKIVVNLLSNAFKYSSQEGEIRVSVEVSSDTKQLVLRVYNTGQGIESSQIEHIFDRYHVLDLLEESAYVQASSRNGLGLSLCRSMVQALDGEIDVQSQVGEYAEFIVRLPHPMADELVQEQIEPTLPSIEKDLSRPIVLVVDDHKEIVWLIASTLSADYTVKEVYSAKEALMLIQQQTPDLIITDIMMPDMSGLELVKILRENKVTSSIPIVIVSARITDNQQAEGLDIGADAYLTKPFSPLVLRSTVNRLVCAKEQMKVYYHSPDSVYAYADGKLLHDQERLFMEEVQKIVKEHIDSDQLGADLIAQKMGMSARTFSRKFKKISDLTPTDFIKDYRFGLAARLLMTTNLNVQEVIYKVGITNKSYFYREFTKRYGTTPTVYRKQTIS